MLFYRVHQLAAWHLVGLLCCLLRHIIPRLLPLPRSGHEAMPILFSPWHTKFAYLLHPCLLVPLCTSEISPVLPRCCRCIGAAPPPSLLTDSLSSLPTLNQVTHVVRPYSVLPAMALPTLLGIPPQGPHPCHLAPFPSLLHTQSPIPHPIPHTPPPGHAHAHPYAGDQAEEEQQQQPRGGPGRMWRHTDWEACCESGAPADDYYSASRRWVGRWVWGV